jgi:hypothetical protein
MGHNFAKGSVQKALYYTFLALVSLTEGVATIYLSGIPAANVPDKSGLPILTIFRIEPKHSPSELKELVEFQFEAFHDSASFRRVFLPLGLISIFRGCQPSAVSELTILGHIAPRYGAMTEIRPDVFRSPHFGA